MANSSNQPSHPLRSEPTSKPAGLHLNTGSGCLTIGVHLSLSRLRIGNGTFSNATALARLGGRGPNWPCREKIGEGELAGLLAYRELDDSLGLTERGRRYSG